MNHLRQIATEKARDRQIATEKARDVVEAACAQVAADYPTADEEQTFLAVWEVLDDLKANAEEDEPFTVTEWEEICFVMACYADDIGYDQINERMTK
jgi:hypothetical protein